MRRLKRLTLLISLIIPLLALPSAVSANDKLKVVVSIVPQKYFLDKIGGDLVDVSVMVLPGSSPATYEPKPQQMVGLTKARIYFAVGVPFEKVWLKKFISVNPEMTVVHTEEGIEKIFMEVQDSHDEKTHQHGIRDPHIWLSPPLVMVQSRNIFYALTRVDPEHKEVYTKNYKSFMREVVDLDLKIRDVFSGEGEGARFMVYHPAWGYFARSYGLKQIPVEIEGKSPTARELEHFVNYTGREGVKAIFVQPQLSSKSAHTIAQAIGCRVIFVDPLAENWAENLLDVADKFNSIRK
jgi:zinc transport system substrate-binding protein